METEQNKICKNCKYFYEHYIKRSTGFISITTGHCCSKKGKKRAVFNYTHNNDTCEFWELSPDRNRKDYEGIRNILQNMRNQLNEIKNVLKD